MKLELVMPESARADAKTDARLVHVHRMTGELAFSLQLVALGLFAVAAAIYLTGPGKEE